MTINKPPQSKNKRRKNKPSPHKINTQAKPHSAGIDIGAEIIVVAVPSECEAECVRTFSSFTYGLKQLRDWLLSHNITTVAMESTANYWHNCYDILESAGIDCYLVNARHVKGVPGKKTDVCDAQWLQQLHAAGLLKKSFRPVQEILALRTLIRHRHTLKHDAADILRRIQKILIEMNLQIHNVFSDIDGASGQAIIKAILAGERDTKVLAALRDGRCQSSEADILAALDGNYRDEYLFVLKQHQTRWEATRKHIVELDEEIEKIINNINTEKRQEKPPIKKTNKKPERKQQNKNAIPIDYPKQSQRFYGVDLTDIEGVGGGLISTLMSEIGTREQLLASFKTADGFCAWLGLCPCNAISGGKVLSSKTRKIKNQMREALRLAAFGLEKSQSKMGEYCRRMKGRLGKASGITATAHKIARIIYSMIASGEPYQEEIAFRPNRYIEKKQQNQLRKLAKQFGYELTPTLDTATS
jgi:transposase